ncbi:Protein BEARSKIN1 [Sesbania bispinosa]|nr:Protein BEARSKIN1 [Sesbania bispinosa]
MTNPRNCESGSDGLRYQVSESGMEVGSCEPLQEMGGGRGEGMNEWVCLIG